MKLTRLQMQYLPAIKWLFSRDKQDLMTGRTTLILYVLLNKAINNLNQSIYLQDHFPTSRIHIDRVILPRIKQMIQDEEFKKYKFVIIPSTPSIICQGQYDN